MDYCGPVGLPRSQFLSWSTEDQDAALAWLLAQRTRCPSCGTYDDEWRDPTDPQHRRLREPPPYVADTRRCRGCELREQESESIPRHAAKGVRVVLVPYDADEELVRITREEANQAALDEQRRDGWGSAPD